MKAGQKESERWFTSDFFCESVLQAMAQEMSALAQPTASISNEKNAGYWLFWWARRHFVPPKFCPNFFLPYLFSASLSGTKCLLGGNRIKCPLGQNVHPKSGTKCPLGQNVAGTKNLLAVLMAQPSLMPPKQHQFNNFQDMIHKIKLTSVYGCYVKYRY